MSRWRLTEWIERVVGNDRLLVRCGVVLCGGGLVAWPSEEQLQSVTCVCTVYRTFDIFDTISDAATHVALSRKAGSIDLCTHRKPIRSSA